MEKVKIESSIIDVKQDISVENKGEATQFGKFGYEIINEQVVIPYTFRISGKYCASKIFWWYFNKQNVKLASKLTKFSYLKEYQMHRAEAQLWNEINEWHNDSMYPFSFSRSDSLIKVNSIRDIFNYVADCRQKLELGAQFKMNHGGMIRIQLNQSKPSIILPYVRTLGHRYVPVHVIFAPNTEPPPSLDVTKLTGIDAMYMRFLLYVLKISTTSKKFKIPCVNLDQLVAQLVTNEDGFSEYDGNFWPTKYDIDKKANSNIIGKVLNELHEKSISVDQHKVSTEQTSTLVSTLDSVNVQSLPKAVVEITPTTLKPPTPKKRNKSPKAPNKISKSEDFYDVDDILAYQMKNGIEMVLIRWTGYSSEWDSWEPLSSLNDTLKDEVNELREKWKRHVNTNIN